MSRPTRIAVKATAATSVKSGSCPAAARSPTAATHRERHSAGHRGSLPVALPGRRQPQQRQTDAQRSRRHERVEQPNARD